MSISRVGMVGLLFGVRVSDWQGVVKAAGRAVGEKACGEGRDGVLLCGFGPGLKANMILVSMHMMNVRVIGGFLLAVTLGVTAVWSPVIVVGEEAGEVICGRGLGSTIDDPSGSRKYAPDREIDVLHVTIDVTPNFSARTVGGKTTLRFVPIAKPFEELKLDAVDLTVSGVEASVPIAGYQVTNSQVIVTFNEPIGVGVEATVTVSHEAEPRVGLYFRTPEMGYRPEDMHLWTQGETHEARHWFPSFDYPNERFTSEMICWVPEAMTVLSNGRLVSEEVEAGLKASRWLQEKPHPNYLIALAAGHFAKIEEKYKEIPLGFYTPVSQIAFAKNSFAGTADMMKFFEGETGVAYPWARYDQVVVDDFTHGGMENTTLTVLTDRTLFPDETENIRSSEGLVAHELAHQWFGDYVTCKDWSQIWLNEGFATYYDALYEEHKHGRDTMLYSMYRSARRMVDAKDKPRPIVYREYKDDWEVFGYRAYQKGGWVLHMLRSQLGPELFRKCIQAYLEENALQGVVTEDLNSAIEGVSGRSFDRFFDQWVYHARFPELDVSYSWDEKAKLAKVTVKQTQAINDEVLLFHFPTKVRFVTEAGPVDREIEIDQKQHDFYFPLEGKPTVVRFDPEFSVLAKVNFDKPKDMLYAQLADASDSVGRLLAIEGLKSKEDKATVEKLKEALQKDSFYGVRIEASEALGEMKTEEAFAALIESMDQPDARVRQQVVEDIGGHYREASLAKIKAALENEKNPDIVAAAIRGLGKYADDGVPEILTSYLSSTSYWNVLAEAAVSAMRTQDDPKYIAPLRGALEEREAAFRSRGFGSALKTLGYLARHEDDREEVRSFLTKYVHHKKRSVQAAAIGALGELRDPKAIPVVSSFSGDRQEDPVQEAAKAALKVLREAKEVSVELGDLRKEVEALKTSERDLKKTVEDIEKRLNATEDPPAKK
jgi:aminopeptidase N